MIQPFEKTDFLGKFNVWALVKGGGSSGQAEAISVAVSRGICVHDPPSREKLDERILCNLDGMTKIDRRQVERKKTGQPKARKKVQWVKR
jgi:small subunit ribosomal protein S9